jgi:hypothetical protein
VNDEFENDVKGSGRAPLLRQYSEICLEGVTKIMKQLGQDSRSPGQYLKPGPDEYVAGMLFKKYSAAVELENLLLPLIRIIICMVITSLSKTHFNANCSFALKSSVRQFPCLLLTCAKAVPLHAMIDAFAEKSYSSYSFLTSAMDGGEWSASRRGRDLAQGRDPRYPLYRRLSGPQSRSGHTG